MRYEIFTLLLAAHIFGDFAFQWDGLIRRKHRFPFLAFHGGIHALATYALLQIWTLWSVIPIVFLLHTYIDWVKQRSGRDDARAFVWDQTAHILSLAVVAFYVTHILEAEFEGIGYRPVVFLAGFLATVRGAGFLVGKVADGLKDANKLQLNGLEKGGALIGTLERALIFLLVFLHQPAGIGFLVAAKSILRFEEARKQELAEYVLIGTLLSFTLAIALASATRWALGMPLP